MKTVGELIQGKLRVGLRRMERVILERMSIRDQEQISPVSLINIRPVVAAIREFFGSSQLSQFMDQTNPLAELRHKRTLSVQKEADLKMGRSKYLNRELLLSPPLPTESLFQVILKGLLKYGLQERSFPNCLEKPK